ncbi:MAG: pyruvate dehydrogenase (acetyl-transferring) E1 component subunit alpha [Ignavibacteriae bacterium]|nr:pyruvate dehydrogenase (acetyl-transferring) E1 component subunit alpha [Ignavibacteriota bacterium]
MTDSATVVAPKKQSSRLMGLSRETLLKWYEEMLLMRRFEEKAAELYRNGKIGGFCHLYNGQEAVSTGSVGALTPDDYVITAYRDHGLAISKGVEPKAIMAELLGKVTGTTKGKGGSMHIFDREKNFLGGHAIVGSHIPLATGAAFASKYRGEKRVCLCYMGDGATNIGAFHEGLNLAALWKLPVIYIIENNQYSMGTSVERSSAVDDLSKKALAYDMRRGVVNGSDVLEVYKAVKAAVEHARQTYEPTLLDIRTFRYRGHSMSDPTHGHYRTKEEVEAYKSHDPIDLFAAILKTEGIIDDTYLEKVEKKIKEIVTECVEFAETSPEPPPDDLWTDVYYE